MTADAPPPSECGQRFSPPPSSCNLSGILSVISSHIHSDVITFTACTWCPPLWLDSSCKCVSSSTVAPSDTSTPYISVSRMNPSVSLRSESASATTSSTTSIPQTSFSSESSAEMASSAIPTDSSLGTANPSANSQNTQSLDTEAGAESARSSAQSTSVIISGGAGGVETSTQTIKVSGSRGTSSITAATSTRFYPFVTSITTVETLTSTSTFVGLSGASTVLTVITTTSVALSTVSVPETTVGPLSATHTGSSARTFPTASHSPSRLPQILGGVLGTFGTLFLLFLLLLAYRRHSQKMRMERFKNIRVRSVQHTPSLAPADVPLRPPRPVSTASSAFLMAESHTDSLEFASATGGNLDGDAMTSSPPPARLRDGAGVSDYLTPEDSQQVSEVSTNRAVLPNPYDAFPWANVGADVARRPSARSEICDDSGTEPVVVITGYAV